MTRNPDLPCSLCGRLMWRKPGKTLPAGEATCRPCRSGLEFHGETGYGKGCRCDVCRAAKSASNAASRGSTYSPAKVCAVCSEPFTATLHAQQSCSELCGRELRRQSLRNYKVTKRGQFVAPVIPAEVFERDGWRCHICRRKLRPSDVVPNLRAATVDHLVPLSRGGTHEPANVRTACYSCNCAKGNRGGNEQLLLIG